MTFVGWQGRPAAAASPVLATGLTVRPLPQVMNAVRSHFAPEFVNRIDEFVVFEPLTQEQIKQIVLLQINRLNKRLGMPFLLPVLRVPNSL